VTRVIGKHDRWKIIEIHKKSDLSQHSKKLNMLFPKVKQVNRLAKKNKLFTKTNLMEEANQP
jgi:hypothetical protein